MALEITYNRHRRHSGLSRRTPTEFNTEARATLSSVCQGGAASMGWDLLLADGVRRLKMRTLPLDAGPVQRTFALVRLGGTVVAVTSEVLPKLSEGCAKP